MDNYEIFYPADETVDRLTEAQEHAVKIRDLAKQEDELTAGQQQDLEKWVTALGTAIEEALAAYDTLRNAV